MRSLFFDRVVWSVWRRHKVARRRLAFEADPLSYANGACVFEGYNHLYSHSFLYDASLGLFSYVAPHARVSNCIVGRFCSIGPNAVVGVLGVHPTTWISTHPVFFSSRKQTGSTAFTDTNHIDELPQVQIGNDVWIGTGAIVLDGRKVGHGAVVGAGALVTKDVAPYAIVGGVPAKVIRMRYDALTVQKLLDMRWWDWPVVKLKALSSSFRNGGEAGVDDLIAAHLRYDAGGVSP